MLRILTLGTALVLAAPTLAQVPVPQTTQDYVKQAGNFFKNCDARADETGQRPDPNYVCLAFMAGLIEGYTTAAVANGNPRPYCLPRPTSLVELADMMATVIERGVSPETPTATVFHFILDTNFPCASEATEDGAAAAPATPTED